MEMPGLREILFGTTNEAKIKQLQGALAPIGVTVRGVADKSSLPEVEEDGVTVQENARKKALTYARALGATVLSMDNGLFLDGLAPEEQPGQNVRRVAGLSARLNDDEMLRYYSQLVRRFGERMSGRWEFGICIATPMGEFEETTIISPRIFTGVASSKTVPGYPLEAMQIDPFSGWYISEMSSAEQDAFWQRSIGQPLQQFVIGVRL